MVLLLGGDEIGIIIGGVMGMDVIIGGDEMGVIIGGDEMVLLLGVMRWCYYWGWRDSIIIGGDEMGVAEKNSFG